MAIFDSALVFTVCLVLVITSAGNFKVSSEAQQYEAKTLEGGCPNFNVLERTKAEILQHILEVCGGPGWRQVVFINMTDTSYDCPPGLNLTSYSKRTCGRANDEGTHSTIFSVDGFKYSRVCGRIRAYQVGYADAFLGYLYYSQSIDRGYATGISLTHRVQGGDRKHIWTFVTGLSEAHQLAIAHCPCDTTSNATFSPPFVGNDYFCESGLNSAWLGPPHHGVLFDDPLWDGWNCTSTSTCCQFNNPPWFTKTLPNPTTDDIELRLIPAGVVSVSDIALELVELYVQ